MVNARVFNNRDLNIGLPLHGCLTATVMCMRREKPCPACTLWGYTCSVCLFFKFKTTYNHVTHNSAAHLQKQLVAHRHSLGPRPKCPPPPYGAAYTVDLQTPHKRVLHPHLHLDRALQTHTYMYINVHEQPSPLKSSKSSHYSTHD